MSDIRDHNEATAVMLGRMADHAYKVGWSDGYAEGRAHTVKPPVEALADALAGEGIDALPGEPDLTGMAERLLALFPGRTEAEVRQDEAERIAAWVTADEPSDTLVLLADALRRGDHRG